MSEPRWPAELAAAIERNSKTCACGARIAFAEDYRGSGKKTPIDLTPGRVVQVMVLDDGRLVCVPSSNGFVNHFVTCPLRARFKKDQKGIEF